jgi:hypothetical protein
MKYFNTLPKVVVTQPDGTSVISTNLLSRVSMIQDLLKDPLLYYSYDIQEGDTPEIIADKYYKDSYRYWIVLLANNMLDPQWDWPLEGAELNDYVASKYKDIDPYSVAHHYEKIITQYESKSQLTTVNVVNIDKDAYDVLENTTVSYTFPSGTTTISTTGRSVTYFQYEYELNESKRSIKLIRNDFAKQFENNLRDLMRQNG